MSEFVIRDISFGGGTLALSPLPGRTRHYGTDRERLLDWRPALVISLASMAELARKGAASLGEDLAAAGIDWSHLPIEDMVVPDTEAEARWQTVSFRARDALSNGQRVLVHCFGGCGRSGMVCLRLMVDGGEPWRPALARLRRVRPCAVETDAQLAWGRGP